MTQIDPREIHALRRAIDEFEQSCGPRPSEKAINVMQAGRRVVMLGTESADRRAWAPAVTTGDPCSACGGPMVRTGTCKTCQHCGASGGCG